VGRAITAAQHLQSSPKAVPCGRQSYRTINSECSRSIRVLRRLRPQLHGTLTPVLSHRGSGSKQEKMVGEGADRKDFGIERGEEFCARRKWRRRFSACRFVRSVWGKLRWDLLRDLGPLPSPPRRGEGARKIGRRKGEGAGKREGTARLTTTRHPHPGPLPSREREQSKSASVSALSGEVDGDVAAVG
jgi:hypothetical protein